MHIHFVHVLLLYNGHSQDGHMSDRNMLVTTIQLTYINKIKVHFLVFSTFMNLVVVRPVKKN